MDRPADAYIIQVVRNGKTRIFTKGSAQVIGVVAQVFSHFVHGEFVGKMIVHIGQNLPGHGVIAVGFDIPGITGE